MFPFLVRLLKGRVYKKCSNALHACLGKSYYRLSIPFKYPGIFADSLAGVHNVLVNCLYVAKRS
jgi:hypothetical protein